MNTECQEVEEQDTYDLTATYSPEDNKLRLYPLYRLDEETYKRVHAAGFRWAPKQELFVAPAWSPEREDLLIELAGEIGDEDTSLVDRAEMRAENFQEHAENRKQDAESASRAVHEITDGIPLGQPILVGHHSERRARKDAERIEKGMEKAVRMWDLSKYWMMRARATVAAAKYKERPDVRARRIKKLEAEERKRKKELEKAQARNAVWSSEKLTQELAVKLAGFEHIYRCFPVTEYPRKEGASVYEGQMSLYSALEDEIITYDQAREIVLSVARHVIESNTRWLAHLGNRLMYEREMLKAQGGTLADRNPLEKGGAVRCWASRNGGWLYIQKVNKVSVTVLDNWGNGGENFTRTVKMDKLQGILSAEEVEKARQEGRIVEFEDGRGFYLKDATPAPVPAPVPTPESPEAEKMRTALKNGVQAIQVPQLFVTPEKLALKVVGMAGIRDEHRVLEPSAGTGALLSHIGKAPEKVAVEVNPNLVAYLAKNGFSGIRIHEGDFLGCTTSGEEGLGTFDRIVMNPPFKNGEDILHIQHARTFLKPGGRLVAICANGPRQQQKLKPETEIWEDLEPDVFAECGTHVNAAICVFCA